MVFFRWRPLRPVRTVKADPSATGGAIVSIDTVKRSLEEIEAMAGLGNTVMGKELRIP